MYPSLISYLHIGLVHFENSTDVKTLTVYILSQAFLAALLVPALAQPDVPNVPASARSPTLAPQLQPEPAPSVASAPDQPYTYGSPPGVVSGLFKSNLTLPPTAYVSFQAVATGPTPKDFNSTLQTYYVNSIAAYLGGSATDVVILRVDGTPTEAASAANGPAAPDESLVHHDPALSPVVAPNTRFSGPAAGPAAGRRRSLLQDDGADPYATTLIIWTAVTLNTSDVAMFTNALYSNTSDILDPAFRIAGGNSSLYVYNIILGKLLSHLWCSLDQGLSALRAGIQDVPASSEHS